MKTTASVRRLLTVFSAILVVGLICALQLDAAVVVGPSEEPLFIYETQPPSTPITQHAPGPTAPPTYAPMETPTSQSARLGSGSPYSMAMPTPPTSNATTPFMNLPRSPTAFGTYGAPQKGTRSQGNFTANGANSTYGRYAPTGTSEGAMISRPPSTPRATISKPFSNYRAPSPISPYMGLYVREGVLGVDNYNAYVAPRLRQQDLNRRASVNIRRLQGTSHIQSREINQLDRRTNTRQPARHMNYGNYFPGLNR